jgi:hypothetical protein
MRDWLFQQRHFLLMMCSPTIGYSVFAFQNLFLPREFCVVQGLVVAILSFAFGFVKKMEI